MIKTIFNKTLEIFGYQIIKINKTANKIKSFTNYNVSKINLCCGNQNIDGYIGIDKISNADIIIDLSIHNIPFTNNSVDNVVCISAINYFSYQRGKELIGDVYRILKQGGIVRFGVQDMETLSKRYINKDYNFYFQKLPNGKDRFEGPTIGDKYAAWFYGYIAGGYPCQYFYDYTSLEYLFLSAGFSIVERKSYLESRLPDINMIDNRQDQMFYLEAIK